MSSTATSIAIPVAGARERDVGKGVARLSEELLQHLQVRPGDCIAITGERMTVAIALPPYPEDAGLEIIRLDGMQRANAGAGIRDAVEVERSEPREARRVTVAPAQPNVHLTGSGDALRRTLNGRPLVAGDVVSTSVYRRESALDDGLFPEELVRTLFEQRAYGLQELRLHVTATILRGVVKVTPQTAFELLPERVEGESVPGAGVTYDDVGGLGRTIDDVREMIELPLKHPELFQRLGIEPPKGVLLHGPPGTGKTLLARAVAHESDATFLHIAGPEIMGRFYGESEQKLRDLFQQAQRDAPSILFIDEIDSIAPRREQSTGEVERRLVAQLLTLMDGLEPRQNVVVIGATNRIEALDEALRRPGRFDREIVIGVPDHHGRREMLGIHTRGMPLADDVDLDALAQATHGFVGADIAALVREAAMETVRRTLPELELDGQLPADVLSSLVVAQDDFDRSRRRIQPSALREILIQIPDVRWEDVGGLEEAKRALQEGVELPLRRPDAFRKLGIRPPRGFLLYGPPGTGKTLLARAVAHEAHANFISARSADLLSKWYGESEKQLARLFRRARQVAPAVLFLDEIDSLAPRRRGGFGEPAVTERVVNTLLAEFDGLEELQGVVVLGATNRPMLLDGALLRPGRFDELVYVPLPDRGTRERVLRIHTASMPLADDVDFALLAERTHGYSGADLEDLARRAGLRTLRLAEDEGRVRQADFLAALEDSRPSVTPEMRTEYEGMRDHLRQKSAEQERIGFAREPSVST